MKKISFLLLLISSKTIVAQMPATSNWLGLQLAVSNNHNWQWLNDAGYRSLGMSPSTYSYHLRTGVGLKLNETWALAAGVAMFFTRTSYQKVNHEFGRENRAWQEMTTHLPIARSLALHSRFRLEERWFGEVTGKAAYFGLRFRERFTIIKTLSENWSLELGDEYLRMLTNEKLLFNSNRILLLARYKMGAGMQLQGGYIWVKLPVSSQHVFTFNFQKNILLRSKKHNT